MRLARLLIPALLVLPTRAGAQSRDSLAVAEVVATLHAALAAGDSGAVLDLLADDVLVLESGATETRAEYRQHHLPADIAFARAVPGARTIVRITVSGDAAWVTSTSRTTGTYRDRPINSAGAELIVLTRESSGWRIRAIHWSSRALRQSEG